MGIYVEGMEMPKGCGVCPFADDECFGAWKCWRVKDWGDDYNRAKGFPLVPVPPHGRLGDIDKLAKRIEYERYHHEHTDGLAARHHIAEYSHFLKAIADTPAVIPAEESNMDSFIRIFEEDDEEDGMDSFIRVLKD